jgi:LacI family xylobiose transport system transcriptional regulator
VVGFDDIPVAGWCAPPLTTVRQPFRDMGETAAQILLTLAAGRTPSQTRVELGITLVIRDSTAPVTAAAPRSPC